MYIIYIKIKIYIFIRIQMNFPYSHTINKIFNIYFTTFPYQLYNYSNHVSNFGLLGISNKLLNAQITFWLANICSIIIIYNNVNYNLLLSAYSIYLYINSFYILINVIKYL